LNYGTIINSSIILGGNIPRVAAFITYTLEDHSAGEHRKALADLVRYFEVVELIVMKIEYFPAGNTVQDYLSRKTFSHRDLVYRSLGLNSVQILVSVWQGIPIRA